MTTARVVSVAASPVHGFSKPTVNEIRLLAGLGVEGDVHCGETVKHRSRVRIDPTQPNLRQVHLVHSELFAELAAAGFDITPGAIGENITTAGIDLLGLPRGARLAIGDEAIVEITGLRNPCVQLDGYRPGLTAAVLGRDAEGRIVRKAGIMGIVIAGGSVRAGDPIAVQIPPEPHARLERV